jgi:hypothetical protein
MQRAFLSQGPDHKPVEQGASQMKCCMGQILFLMAVLGVAFVIAHPARAEAPNFAQDTAMKGAALDSTDLNAEANGQHVLNAKDHGSANYAATYVPEPATLSVLVLGGLVMLRRHRAKARR